VEFTCTVFGVKLTEIFQVKFYTDYEKSIHIVPKFRKISPYHIAQHTRTYTHTLTHIHTYTHYTQNIDTHTYTHIFTQPYTHKHI